MKERWGEIIRIFFLNEKWHWALVADPPEFGRRRGDSCCEQALRNGRACSGCTTRKSAVKASSRRIVDHPSEVDARAAAPALASSKVAARRVPTAQQSSRCLTSPNPS